ncbi:MAG: PLP-dependent aminotransferase family protein, partial [Actinobacteria bacterium]|nr:PLP-dependent aminotransferase family protein [Actinomycetota bacterium]
MLDDNSADRVIAALRAAVTRGAPGSRLPTVRDLIAEHGVGPSTVQRALGVLAREGLLETRPGDGTYIAARPTSIPIPDLAWQTVALGGRTVEAGPLGDLLAVPRPGIIALSSGYLDPDLQPTVQLAAAAARAGRRPGSWQRPPVEGLAELRAWFARDAGGGIQPHEVLICSGGQAALSTAFRALAPPGGAVLFESPTYLGALAAARAAGLRTIPVPVDSDGVRPDLLAAAFAQSDARLFYCQPLHANPHGAVLAADRRRAVLDAVATAGAFLVEDDYARDLTIDGDPPPPLVAADTHGHVVYIRSLTKPAAPGLRVAALAARGAAAARLRAIRMVDDFFVAGPLQETALELVAAPSWPRHLRRVRKALRERRDTLVAAVRENLGAHSLPLVPTGGFH